MILIRADANEQIGTGHVMRCLSIAKAFAKRGIESKFVVADERGRLLIEQNGFSAICINSNWQDMESELNEFMKVIYELNVKNILVDSYYVTPKYLKILSERCKVVYLDDMNRECYDVDTIINYNIYAKTYDYSGYNGTRTELLLNPQYTPLREEFEQCSRHKIKKVTDIFVSAGGSDPERITERIMKSICQKMPDIYFHFIVGALNPRLNNIRKIADIVQNAILHINERNMSCLMEKCDIAISAAGTTLYELCATGVPTITYILADNQLVAAEQFEKQGIMLNAGDCRGDSKFISRVEQLLKELCENKKMRIKMSERMESIIDGYGARRIVDALFMNIPGQRNRLSDDKEIVNPE